MPSFSVYAMNIIFATHNRFKTQEIRDVMGAAWTIRDLHDLGLKDEIPETADTLQGNALQKATYVLQRYHANCFADDTGLEIEALNGRPGVFSARYAGEHCSFVDNMNKVLREMQGVPHRKACFKTVICLIWNGQTFYFEGKVDGQIIETPTGSAGFGYDPIFVPDGYAQTFAEMGEEEKNKISHRARATRQLLDFLKQIPS